MADVIWPWKVLKPQNLSIDLAPRNLRGQSATNSFTQVSSNSAGIWRGEFSVIPVYSASLIRLWRAIASNAEGQLNAIILPAYDLPRAPLPNGVTESYLLSSGGVPHSDGTPFSDSSLYSSSYINIETIGTYLVGAVTLNVIKNLSGDLEPGHRFSIGTNLYEIKLVTEQTSTTATIVITPPLRNDITTVSYLNFDKPVVRVRLASDNEMFLPLNFNKQSFPTIKFFEDV